MEREYALERNERRKRLSSQVQRWRDRRQHCSAALLGCLHGRGLVLGGKEDSHAEVSSREFGEAWEAMEQGVLQAGVAAAGVSNTKVVLEVLGSLRKVLRRTRRSVRLRGRGVHKRNNTKK